MANEATTHGADAAWRRTHPVILTFDGELVHYCVERRQHPDGNVAWSSADFLAVTDRNGIIVVSDRLGVVVARYREWSALTLVDPHGRPVMYVERKEIEV